MKNRAITRHWLLTALWLSLLLGGCNLPEYLVRMRQVRTFADLQTVCGKLSNLQNKRGGSLPADEVAALISSVADGKDAWGNAFQYRALAAKQKSSYIVLSYGGDGQADIQDVGGYFFAPNKDVRGNAAADIVFRDGLPLTLAGK